MLNKSNTYMNYCSVSQTVFRRTVVFRELFKVFSKFYQSLTLLQPNSQSANACNIQMQNAKCKCRRPNSHFAKINLCKCLKDWKLALIQRQAILGHNKLFSRSICR